MAAGDYLSVLSHGLVVTDQGAADYPAESDVRGGVAYASGGFTGTLTLPAVGAVAAGTHYGAGGTEFTGTLTLPGVSDVRVGVAVGTGTGTLSLPAVGDVELGVGFGAGGSEFVGTFHVPGVGDVRLGTGYGAAGSEFTGTLSVPTPGPPGESVAETIAIRIKEAIEAESFTFGSPPVSVSVVVRKTPISPSGKSVPELVVTISDESKSEALDALTKLETFSAWVTFVTPGGHKLLFDSTVGRVKRRVQELLDDRGRVTFATLITGATFNRCDFTGAKPPFDPAALLKDLNWSVIPMEISVLIERATS